MHNTSHLKVPIRDHVPLTEKRALQHFYGMLYLLKSGHITYLVGGPIVFPINVQKSLK